MRPILGGTGLTRHPVGFGGPPLRAVRGETEDQVEDESQGKDGDGRTEGEGADPGPVQRESRSYDVRRPRRHIEPAREPVATAAPLKYVPNGVFAASQDVVIREHYGEDRHEERTD